MINEDKREHKVKVSVFKDRVEINIHPWNPLKDIKYIESLPPIPQKVKNPEKPFMTKRQDARSLKRWRKKLFKIKLDYDKFIFMTLGTQEEMTWNEVLKKFNLFLSNLRYKYGDVKIVRKIECYNNGFNRYHIHVILIFNDVRPSLSKDWLKEHWKYGKVHFEYGWKNKQYGVLEYITNVKECNFNPNDKMLTKYPENAKVISVSPDLIKEKAYYSIDWTKEQYNSFINEVKKCQGQIFYDGHYYGKDKYCLDRVFIHNAEDIINKL